MPTLRKLIEERVADVGGTCFPTTLHALIPDADIPAEVYQSYLQAHQQENEGILSHDEAYRIREETLAQFGFALIPVAAAEVPTTPEELGALTRRADEMRKPLTVLFSHHITTLYPEPDTTWLSYCSSRVTIGLTESGDLTLSKRNTLENLAKWIDLESPKTTFFFLGNRE